MKRFKRFLTNGRNDKLYHVASLLKEKLQKCWFRPKFARYLTVSFSLGYLTLRLRITKIMFTINEVSSHRSGFVTGFVSDFQHIYLLSAVQQ